MVKYLFRNWQKSQKISYMYNKYKYIDLEFIYTDQNIGVMKNIPQITDYESLMFFESSVVAVRLQELAQNPIHINYANDLLEIHRYLFQDVYEWAGQLRRVEISKGGRQFLPMHAFPQAFAFLDKLLLEYWSMPNNKYEIAHKLAQILDNINFLHPFREGNGRTQREFLRLLALQRGYMLDLNPLDNQSVYDRYMSGTINGDVTDMTNLIAELLIDINRHNKDNAIQ